MYLITIITDNKPSRFYTRDLVRVTQFIGECSPQCVMVEPLPLFPAEDAEKGVDHE